MTVKSLTELPGMTADNVKELESIGITSVSELTEAVNDIPVFKRNLTVQEVAAFFNECRNISEEPLIANRNEVFVYFLSMLHFHSVISDRYQSVISARHLVLSSSGRKYLTRKDLSTALAHFESIDSPIKARIDRWVVLVRKETLPSGHNG